MPAQDPYAAIAQPAAPPPSTPTSDPYASIAVAGKKDYWGNSSDEVGAFLAQNPGKYQYLDSDPRFPNRRPGIYPAGPGSEWRSNAESPNHDIDQFPIDLHDAKHSWEGFKMAAGMATAPLSMELTLPELIGGVLGGVAGDAGGRKLAKAAGGGDVAQEAAGTAGGLIGGGLGSKLSELATSGARAIYESLPTDLQNSLRRKAIGMASPRLKNALDFWDTLGKIAERGNTTPKPDEELDATGENKPYAGEKPPKPPRWDAHDATGENRDYAGEPPPKPPRWDAHDATGENKPFAGGMDEWSPPVSKKLPLGDLAPETSLAKQRLQSVVAPEPVPAPTPAPVAPQPAAGSMARSVAAPKAAAKTGPADPWANDPLMNQLRAIAAKIDAAGGPSKFESSAEEPEKPQSLDDDLTPLLLESLKQVKARRAVQ